MGSNGPKIESSLGLGDVRTDREGFTPGLTHPPRSVLCFSASRGHHKLQSGRKEDPQALVYPRGLCACLSCPGRGRTPPLLSMTCCCRTPPALSTSLNSHFLWVGPQSSPQSHWPAPQLTPSPHWQNRASRTRMRAPRLHRAQRDPLGGPGRGGRSMRRCGKPLRKRRWAEWVGIGKARPVHLRAPASLLLPESYLPTLGQDCRTAAYRNLSVNPSV